MFVPFFFFFNPTVANILKDISKNNGEWVLESCVCSIVSCTYNKWAFYFSWEISKLYWNWNSGRKGVSGLTWTTEGDYRRTEIKMQKPLHHARALCAAPPCLAAWNCFSFLPGQTKLLLEKWSLWVNHKTALYHFYDPGFYCCWCCCFTIYCKLTLLLNILHTKYFLTTIFDTLNSYT